ncbi:acetolactate synthase small subunit [Actinomyces vulturis]|uniref:acetolactate synthase small subunit n=1 Tax=Actinomyces vulturis TaxID=1857645 RepID=UPI00082D4FDC|nr:acetolactate synthase small subunit [Actinomyces vulturis]
MSSTHHSATGAVTTHTLSVLVENKPGVLTRVTALFSRRGFNIDSLAVGPTERPDVSRITVIARAHDAAMDQITKQLDKLINVLKVEELKPESTVERELLLIKVHVGDDQRANAVQIVDLFRAHVVDVSPESLVVETTGSRAKVQALLTALSPYGLAEIVQSGTVAIGRGPQSLTDAIS